MLKKCNHPGCPNVFDGKGYLCPDHRYRNFDAPVKREPKRNSEFYKSSAWVSMSKRHRAKYPICERCEAKASQQVDHHLEIELDPHKKYIRSPNNFVALCLNCHLEKGLEIRRLIKRGNINAIRRYLIENHPRPEDVDYLSDCEISLPKE